ncbi:guanine nucleotide-binding protein-like 1 [Saccoglossus kowalevskii]|uniref:Guanine nucleotide-binding protein-like 1 n=1 Tax=Saccoglossus kowalevskii TaxID=10224 RepID=A0ABM0MEH5_SACKO|nr:PREDICTED: guanine nucleotide-binding protein-like 1-like [Saccoglossus kowalevskii]
MPRKKPFSVKQKKKQLQDKRETRRNRQPQSSFAAQPHRSRVQSKEESNSESNSDCENNEVFKVNHQPAKKIDQKYDPNRFRLHFERESKVELSERKKRASEPFLMLSEENLEVDIDDIYKPGSVLDMPKRPPWEYSLTKEQVEKREEIYFNEYLENIYDKYTPKELSYFEHNLETWRQLWRVLEMSDIVLLITDIRHPILHFSPALYNYVIKDLKKQLILVLNKIDLAPSSLVVAWKHYFQTKFPELRIVCFTAFPKERILDNADPNKKLNKKRRRGHFTAVGPKQLFIACENICKDKVDLSSWKNKIEAEIEGEDSIYEHIALNHDDAVPDASYEEHVQFKEGMLTIGCVGHPNVGKSSLMNGLVGKKVVSASRTPGHTKHFQTIFLTHSVKLCDSPGLIFPAIVDKQLQILSGIYPIAQVQEPYSAVGYLAQRIPLSCILKLKHPNEDTTERGACAPQWSAYDICDAWAEKRGFITAKAGRNDTYRAANNILRLAVEGRLVLCMSPVGYTAEKAKWESHPETKYIAALQEQHRELQLEDEQQSDLSRDFTSSEGDSDADVESEVDSDRKSLGADRAKNIGFFCSNPFSALS